MTQGGREPPRLGPKVRALRRRESLSQVQLAGRLGISAELPEPHRVQPAPAACDAPHQAGAALRDRSAHVRGRRRRPPRQRPARGLRRSRSSTRTSSRRRDLRDLAVNHPQMARAMLALYTSYKTQRGASEELASRLDGEEAAGPDQSLLPSEEVSDLIQSRMNYFPELEEGAEELWKKGRARPRGALPGARALPRQAARGPRADRAWGGGARGPSPLRRREEDPDAERALADAIAHVPDRSPDRASDATTRRIDRIVGRRPPDDRRVARPRARRARELLRGRRAHAVHALSRGVPARALRPRRHRPALPRRLRAGLPPASRRCGGRAPRACPFT